MNGGRGPAWTGLLGAERGCSVRREPGGQRSLVDGEAGGGGALSGRGLASGRAEWVVGLLGRGRERARLLAGGRVDQVSWARVASL